MFCVVLQQQFTTSMKDRSSFRFLGLAIFMMAFTLSHTGLIPLRVILCPRHSNCERAKNDFVMFTLSPALCSLLRPVRAFQNGHGMFSVSDTVGHQCTCERMLIRPSAHSSSLQKCLGCCTIPSGLPAAHAFQTAAQQCTVVWKRGSSECDSSPC